MPAGGMCQIDSPRRQFEWWQECGEAAFDAVWFTADCVGNVTVVNADAAEADTTSRRSEELFRQLNGDSMVKF
jgi:hypothetical protein